jgi:hypothetical protein
LRYDERSGALTMIGPANWPHQSPLPDLRSVYEYAGPASLNVGLRMQPVNVVPPAQGGIPWGAPLLGGLTLVAMVVLASDNQPKKRCCGACGRLGHQRKTVHVQGRAHFSQSVPKSRRCQCCGQSRYETQRHHPRGRADASDRLDVCGDCDLVCGHNGHYRNPARKPYVCRIKNRPSAWRDRTNR